MSDDASPIAAARAIARQRMVTDQIARRGVRDPAVLEAMRTVPREAFLPLDLHPLAYDDTPLPIAAEQTISQPYIVALMAEALALEPADRVLEVGTGSGYAAAVLSRIAAEVYSVERHAGLAAGAAAALAALGYGNARVLHGDGTQGWPEHAPYDAIVVAAGSRSVPPALRAQLTICGRLVIPLGDTPHLQELVRILRTGPDSYRQENLGGVRFVPLVGTQGWLESPPDASLTTAWRRRPRGRRRVPRR
ncbi:MAG: protein-L-isoaspartate(D-aspartate) O-methyltransferase [Gemmatimonadota bacterium]